MRRKDTSLVPIVTAFDRNLNVPAEVSFVSLIENSLSTTHYEFIVLCCLEGLPESSRDRLRELISCYPSSSITFIEVGDSFSTAFEIRGITVPTYYRLLLPDLLPNYEKVLYLDVDTIVLTDLSDLYSTNLNTSYLAGVRGVYHNSACDRLASLKVEPGAYINAGVILMNLELMRRDGLVPDFVEMANGDLEFQDQDVLNSRCANRITYLPAKYNVHAMYDYEQNRGVVERLFGEKDVQEVLSEPAIIHFAGRKPWESNECFFYDYWWEYYRKTRFFDVSFYRSHQRQLMELARQRREQVSRDSLATPHHHPKVSYFDLVRARIGRVFRW